ncbi:SulP family inorganic anion transporter [Nocardia cyriacigeorgica]|uniref:SulP family inorganic anion transporter n=1 Tax=Nocardia cyriacigeorgica TaxID=135487 RepID=UPI001895E324|nr:SulP family inorganic anion transporter [Nocardia cyriacigeorgica]MBF6160491.1 SulP family inorganic anion transporter [Nocardia cyriacigeorgica]MBF6199742.1 SulP family inorganic anion transporter [Nocardia cyriacigeorgica]MBF6319959.1 SulP family inorganic anion transporter [Nocardia cyriacigeorgica]MBF6517183.1 SulP family inorganic anion transporter [Nocardia cyriacigeorgica]MBF6534377.1 SulP family inorganic anion transporter [Nocardia cyriacigeorgica]
MQTPGGRSTPARPWPVFLSLQHYRRGWLRADVLAGLTVWAVLVPEALAYASIAGVPPVVGLYAAIPALVLYALAGSSRHLVVGPMSATAALSAAIITPLAGSDGARFVALSTALAIATGIVGLIAGLIRLGFIAAFISEPVLKGFIVGLAVTIIIGQVPKLFGIEKEPGNFFEQAWGVIRRLGDTHWRTLLIGLLSLAVVLGLKRWLPLVPGSLLAVLLGIAAVTVFDLDKHGVAIVGHIDAGLPSVGMPDGVGVGDLIDLLGPAVGVLLIGFAEGLGAAKTYAAKAGYEVDANRELFGLGAANLGSGLSSGMVVNGSLSKTAVNGSAGARTQLSGLVVAVLVVLTLLFLTGLFENLPEATLAGVVIAAVIELVDIAALRRLYRVWTARLGSIYGHAARADFLAAIAAMAGVLLFDTLPGLVIGIGVSMLLLLYRTAQPHIATLAKDGTRWVDAERRPELERRPDVLVVRVESGLLFANADYVKQHIEAQCGDRTKLVVLDAETSPVIDVTAAQMLAELRTTLARRRIEFAVARDVGQFRDALGRSAAGAEQVPVYPTVHEAIDALDR